METFILYLIIYIAEAIIFWLYAHQIFSTRFRLPLEFLALSLCYMALFGLNLLQSSLLNVTAFLIANFLLLLVSYQTSPFPALIHAAVVTVSMTFGELIAINCLFQIAYDFYARQHSFRDLVISTILNKLIYFFILQLILCFLARRKRSQTHADPGIVILVISSLISFFFILTLITICENVNYSDSLDWMITVSVILMLILNLLIFGLFNYSQKKNAEFTNLQLRLQREEDNAQYQKMLLQEDEAQKILIHDIRKHLQTIAALNRDGGSEKVDFYIADLVSSADLQTNARFSDNALLNSILGRYLRQCREKQISFYTDIRRGSVSFLSDRDMTSLFCNLLDNAVEACASRPAPMIELSAVFKEELSLTVVTLVNSSRELPLSCKSKWLSTTKARPAGHGLGLKSIRYVTDKYHGDMNMYYERETGTFHTVLTLYPISDHSESPAEHQEL